MNSLEDKILEVRNSTPITRTHIAGLLSFIGEPGDKRPEKIEAVRQLNQETPQGYRVEDSLESYGEF